MTLFFRPNGTIVGVYGEAIDLTALGQVTTTRASHVEPAPGGWTADMAPVGGPVLGPFPKRSDALAAETAWLDRHLAAGGAPAR